MSLGTLVLLVLILFSLSMLPTVWAIKDVVYRDFDSLRRKKIWIAVTVLIPCLGGVVYLVFGRKQGRILR